MVHKGYGAAGPSFVLPLREFQGSFLMREAVGVTENSKTQISNSKQMTMIKIQNSKPVSVI
jgi:hypothetical protein